MRKRHILPAMIFAFLILYRPSLGPIDDHLFLKPFHWLQFWFNDRFYILDGIEQFFITRFLGVSPFLYYLVNSVEFLILFFLLGGIVKNSSQAGSRWMLWLPALAILTPGITTAYLRLLVPERLLVLCLSGIVYLDLNGYRTNARKIIYLCLALTGFFLKEPTFLIIGGLAFFNYVEKRERPFQILLFALSITYFLLYLYLTRIAAPAGIQYGETSIKGLPLLAKNLYNFALNDPLIFGIVIPLFLGLLARKKVEPYAAIVTGYSLIFLYLGIYQEYYLLPVLPFVLFLVCKWWPLLPKVQRTFAIFLYMNCAVYSLGQISIYKNEPSGFFQTMQYLGTVNLGSAPRVCYLGLNTEFSSEILHASEVYFRHLHPNRPTPEFVSTESNTGANCDLLLQSPYNYTGVSPEASLSLIHEEKSAFWIPPVSIKPLIKRVLIAFGKGGLVNSNTSRRHDWAVYHRGML